ncbi:extracellular solute-binding protein [Fodinicola acaciae]|uniref:ABC transporter substrate-binding protein n=1 Tax=Fodinicola acaciae TaxID=2681555 RepID=UPI0013D66A89|nr:sugar ABC transporter substrate-binding protein [Fodinicola acaciae]
MPQHLSRRSLLAAGLALPLGACAAGQTATTGGKAARITFWSALRGSKEVVAEFNKTHRTIQVDFQQIPSGDQGGYAKLSNAARAGNAPDVATIEYPQVPGFAIDGVATDLSSLLDDKLRAKLLPASLRLTTFDNKVFSVPIDVEPMVMHYRTDLFQQYGLKLPRTWDEFEALARTVRAKAPTRRLAVFATDAALNFASYCWQAGAQWFDIRGGVWNVSMADAQTRRIAAFWQRLIDEDLVWAGPGGGRQNDARLGQGLVLVRLSGAWDAGANMKARPKQKGKWAIAPMPQWDLAHPAVGTQGGSTFAVTKDSRHPEAAMEFIAWQVADPAALTARLKSGASSQYPAVPELVSVDRKAFPGAYYNHQDIYSLFDQEAHKIRDGWIWGPRMSATQRVMQDGFARAGAHQDTLIDAVRAAQSGTMPDLRALGLATSEHSS